MEATRSTKKKKSAETAESAGDNLRIFAALKFADMIRNILLFLSAAASFGVLAAPFATPKEPVQAAIFTNDGVYNVQDQIGLLVCFAVAGALAVASLVLYFNRVRELRTALSAKRRIVSLSLVANLAGLAFAVFYLLQQVRFEQITPSFGLFLPVIAILCAGLAIRILRQDERTIRSSDRLR